MTEIERPTANSARAVRTFAAPPPAVLEAVVRAASALPRWSVASRDDEGARLVRATRLLRFKDDVTVRVSPEGGGARAEFASASRVGKGDMGQNPRNLRELLAAVEGAVGAG